MTPKERAMSEPADPVLGGETRDRLAAIRKRAEEATPGPWRLDTEETENTIWARGKVISGVVAKVNTGWVHDFQCREQEANAHFIASAREDIPWLLGEVSRLRERAENAEAREGWLHDLIGWALGESPLGFPDFPSRPDNAGLYWWRIELRRLAGFENPHAIARAVPSVEGSPDP